MKKKIKETIISIETAFAILIFGISLTTFMFGSGMLVGKYGEDWYVFTGMLFFALIFMRLGAVQERYFNKDKSQGQKQNKE